MNISIDFWEDVFPFIFLFSPFIVIYFMYLYHSFMFKKYGHYYFEQAYKKVFRENFIEFEKSKNSNNNNDNKNDNSNNK